MTKNGLGHAFGAFFTNPSGVDVMITIFCDFRLFRQKLQFFSKKQRHDRILQKVAVV
jgi:hypothetical protein